MKSALFALCVALVTNGCGSVKEYVPINPRSISLRVPNQQRLVATAVGQAVKQACRASSLNLRRYAGKTGRVEVNGVFPHSAVNLLSYVASSVELEMAKAGMLVMPRHRQVGKVVFHVKPDSPKPALLGVLMKQPDVRVVASIDWGGIDYTDKKYVDGGVVAGMVLVGLVTFGVGAIIWLIADTPYRHSFTLDARAKITVKAIPTVPRLQAAVGSGEGSSRIVIDTQSDSGYAADIMIPKKD